MHRIRRLLVAIAALEGSAFASVTTTVDLVDPSDGITQPPPGLLAVDVIVDVSSQDCWTAAGMRAFVTSLGQAEGVRIEYLAGDDPNAPIPYHIVNPGVEHRFVTFLTQPHARDADARYTSGDVAVLGRYAPGGGGPNPITTPFEFNVEWLRWPPADANSPSVDGAIARIAIDVGAVLDNHPGAWFEIGARDAAVGPIIVESATYDSTPGTVSASFDAPTPRGLDWAVWYIPEPASIALVLLGAVAVRRR